MTTQDRPYRGPDRRTTAEETFGAAVWLWLAASVVMGAGAGLTAWWGVGAVLTVAGASAALPLVTGTLALLSGGGWLARWRLVGDAPAALLGVGLILLGAGMIGGAGLARVGLAGATDAWLQIATDLGALALLAAAMRAPRVDSGLRPGRLLGGLTAALVALGVAAAVVAGASASAPASALVVAGLAARAAAWAGLGAAFAWRAGRSRQPLAAWAAVLTVGLGAALAAEAAGHGAAEAIRLAVWGASAAGSAWAVRSAIDADRLRARRLAAYARAAERRVERVRAAQDDLAHEAGNALAAIDIAVRVLQDHHDQLDRPRRDELRTAVRGEIDRLKGLVNDSAAPRPAEAQTFDLCELLAQQTTIARARGLDVDLRCGNQPLLAAGRANEVAQVVANLLGNVERHAPGATARIDVSRTARHVEVRVADRGPGIPSDLARRVFERAARGTQRGSGLGLAVSAELLERQGGAIWFEQPPRGGAAFAFRLAATDAADPAPPATAFHQRDAGTSREPQRAL